MAQTQGLCHQGGVGGAGGVDNALGKVASDYLSLLPSLHEGAKAFGLDLPAMMGKPHKPDGAAPHPEASKSESAQKNA